LAALAFCCTTDFDLQRHLQQFYPPFMRLVTRQQIEAHFFIPESPQDCLPSMAPAKLRRGRLKQPASAVASTFFRNPRVFLLDSNPLED
jgi:hypothetical protein